MPHRPVLLAVDDEADFLTTYRRLLGREGFRVVTAATRAEALAALAAEQFAVVVTDVRLPDGDGLDVVRAAADHARKATPIIVVSGFTSRHARETALAAGAADFFAKPFEAAALASRIRELAGAG